MRKVLAAIMSVSLCFAVSGVAFAASPQSKETIPKKMTPGTVITYDQNNNMKIVTKGYDFGNQEQPVLEKNEKKYSAQLPSGTIVTHFENEPVYLPTPTPGMTVSYDGSGNPSIIKGDPNFKANISYIQSHLSISSSNTDTITPDVGFEGNLTWFTDATGDNGHKLQNYDCATKIGLDNPPSGTTIYTQDLDDELSTILYKWDTGSLPTAILDIRPYVWQNVFGRSLSDGYIWGDYSHD